MTTHRFFAGFSLFSLSLLAHGTFFYSLDHAISWNETKLLNQERRIQAERDKNAPFEFVEAPPKIHAAKPKAPKKISNRDALNQNPLQSNAAGSPLTPVQGPSDQLAQRRGSPSQAPAPKSEPKPQVMSGQEKIQEKAAEQKDQTMIAQRPQKNISQTVPAPEQASSPLVNPKTQVLGSSGQDKITTQEMSKTRSRGAELFGTTSFEATGSGMGEYMKNLKERIWMAWFPYLAFQYPQDFQGADAVISFTLDAKGEVKIVKIVESAGSPLFASYCVDAIQKASGFGALPQEMLDIVGKEGLEIRFGFHYR